jgi:hypothetical protein
MENPQELMEPQEIEREPETMTTKTSVFTEAQMKMMIEDARQREKGIPRDAKGLEPNYDEPHQAEDKNETSQEEASRQVVDPQMNLPFGPKMPR